jgi:hypothetical protein
MEIDLRRLGKTELTPDEVPSRAERLLLSYNNIRTFPSTFFYSHSSLWELDLSHNRLTSLDFLRCYRALGILDISWNHLPIISLLDLRSAVILRLTLHNNRFDDFAAEFPMFIPTLLRRCWIINDSFITDAERTANREYEATLAYGNALISVMQPDIPSPLYFSASQTGRMLLNDRELGNKEGIEIIPPYAEIVIKHEELNQIHRLAYLTTVFPMRVPEGTFTDYFGVSVAILGRLWIGEPIGTVPHFLCPGYWFDLGDDVKGLKKYELMILLYQISEKSRSAGTIENGLWKGVGIAKYLQSGKTPWIGSTARLIVSAFIARALAVSPTAALSPEATDDLRAYFKFRKSAGCRNLDSSIESVYNEIVAPIWQNIRVPPKRGDPIDIIHPLTSAWTRGRVITATNGRVYAAVDNVISQLVMSSVFWDGRGFWREAGKRETAVQSQDREREQKRTFITAADQFGNAETALDLAAIGQSFAAPAMSARVAPPDPITFPERGRRSPRRTSTETEGQFMNEWRTFRGIVEPPVPVSERSFRSPRPNPRRAEMVQTVVNVIPGRDVGAGPHPKRFNVQIVNTITGRSHYTWVTEDDVSPDDAERLMILYREHVTKKLRTGPHV